MAFHRITKGLDLPIKGKPAQEISKSSSVSHVALLGSDYPTMKPRMHANEGDEVKRGQLLFEDRKSEGVHFTAPGAGKIVAINRGEKRRFSSLVIELNENEKKGKLKDADCQTFEHYKKDMLKKLDGEKARALLSESGLWTALRTRPFSRVPATDSQCHSIFVTAIDTNPLAPSVETVIKGQEKAFENGMKVLSTLTEGKIFLCVGEKWETEIKDIDRVQKEVFIGPHPAGLVGTHIHVLAPASRKRTVWHIGYQDVISIGHLFTTGQLHVDRVVAVGGPACKEPTLLKTRVGASSQELLKDKIDEEKEVRIVSGSVLHGSNATDDVLGFLGRYDQQFSLLEEGRTREFMGWMKPGVGKFSTIKAFLSSWLPKKDYAFTTTTNGSHRAMVPIGMFERVMPLDIMPTFLLRSLLVTDLERAEQLGCLELHEEDLALCAFVSPGKEDYGKALRKVLTEIWQEG
ncbi:MAG TPA: NADH:ubiquinone reductase (Na(+)-transporting) subunit A [Myxococcales bacterium]|nr:NADH:ubiquinone reductase (Na(+)-transporting) subunit A [Myxococcales bacterium]